MALSQYFAPVAVNSSGRKLGWLREAYRESEIGVESCYGYDLLDEDLRIFRQIFPDMLSGFSGPALSSPPLSTPTGAAVNRGLHIPQVKRMLSEMTAILGNIEPSWTHTASNEELRDVSDKLDACTRVWWERTHAVERIIETIQWSAVNRTGYIFPKWNPHFHGINQGDIELGVGGPKSFFPLWCPKSNDIQQAYAGTIVEDMPIHQFGITWPTLVNSVKVNDQATANLAQQAGRAVGNALRGAAELFDPSTGKKQFHGQVPAVRVYYTYIRDMSMNLTGNPVEMGTPRTYWNYRVPAVGSDIPTGLINPNTGQDLTRKAQPEDCYLYPWLRLVIWTNEVVCYDGPSHAFHGKIPAVKLTLDPWPWDYLGGSLVRDIASQAEAFNRLARSIDHREQKKAKPPRQVNMDMIDDTTAESLKRLIETPGELVKVDSFREGEVIRALDDPRNNEIQQWELEYGKSLIESMTDILGLNNLQRLAESRQIPSGDTSEKLLQITGARTQRKGNIMERFCADLAPMVDGLMLEWYTAKFRWRLFGYKGQTIYDYDHDPGTMVPASIPGRPLPTGMVFGDGRSGMFDSRIKRARYLMTTMGVQIERGSLLDVTSMTRQLLELKLYSDPNFPKDPISLAESLRLSNIGQLDDGEDKDSRIGRAKKWARIQTETIAALQAMAQQIMAGADPQAQMAQMLQALGAGAGAGGGAHEATGNPEGRPSSYQASPQLETRDNGQRTIINTSNTPRE